MHVSRFDVLVTLAYVTSTLLWVVVPLGGGKPPRHLVIGRLASKEGMEPTGGLEPPAFSLPRKCW